ncbi:protein DMP4-like [Macadamia integrifolia]|uniref:protein DMP4-like n=1 Tax=Macadamia integrifolia TaxID=60698 RepID=UPI001C52B271|nr:protein DMP4-like [Macadamia integrifolia]
MAEGQKNRIMDEESRHHDHQRRPLLRRHSSQRRHSPSPDHDRINHIHKAISLLFHSTSNLANLLPTGTVFAFQLLSPIFSDQGECDMASRHMTAGLVMLCGLSCFLSSFTDSFRDEKGVVHYGIATFRGLWIIDWSLTIPPDQASEYRLKFIDFLHAFMSTLVFSAVALFNQNVVNCFYPTPSEETMELLTELPVGIGAIGSAFFLTFPTTRHGFGFPLSPR